MLPWTSLVQQVHLFDDEGIRQGADSTLLDWILRGASHVCSSCHASFHSEELDKPGWVKPSDIFAVFNNCLEATHSQYCCFVCGGTFPLSNKLHAVECFQQDFDSRSARSLQMDDMCLFVTRNFQQWKHVTLSACPISSCIDVDWHLDNDNAFMTGTAVVKSRAAKRAGTWLGGDWLTVFTHSGNFLDHLSSHFFEADVITLGSSRRFRISIRLPVTLDASTSCDASKQRRRPGWHSPEARARATRGATSVRRRQWQDRSVICCRLQLLDTLLQG